MSQELTDLHARVEKLLGEITGGEITVDTDDTVCLRCDSSMNLRDGCEPTSVCDSCAQELAEAFLRDAPLLLAEAKALREERDLQTDRAEMWATCAGRYEAELAKLREQVREHTLPDDDGFCRCCGMHQPPSPQSDDLDDHGEFCLKRAALPAPPKVEEEP